MCCWNVSLLSTVTPSVPTVSESSTAVPSRLILESKRKEHMPWYEPEKIASDMSGFIIYNQTIEDTSMRGTAQVLVYQTDQCVIEQYGAKCHPSTTAIGFQSA